MKRLADSPILELVAVIGTICAFSFSVGFVYPVVALNLEAQGYDEGAIGLNATASGIGVLVAGLLVPRFVGWFGTFSLLGGSVVLAIGTLLLFPVLDSYEAWLVLRFSLGFAITILFAGGEAWINAIADEETRGRTMAIYVASMASCFASGSLAVAFLGYEGFIPFLVASCVILICFLPIIPFHGKDPLAEEVDALDRDKDVLWTVLKHAIVLMAVVALFGILDGVALSLLPSYAIASGIPREDGSLPLAAMAFGVVLLQLPLGYLSDRMRRTRLLTLILFSVVGLAAIMPLADMAHWSGYLYLMLFGGLSFAPYTIALAILGERYKGQKLAAGSALFAIMWGLGSTVGPVVFGVGMEAMGSLFLPYGLAILFLVTGAVSWLDRTPAPRQKETNAV